MKKVFLKSQLYKFYCIFCSFLKQIYVRCLLLDYKSISGQQQKWQLRREGWHESNFLSFFSFFSLPFLYPFVTGEGEEERDGPNWLQRPLTVAHAPHAVWLKHTPKNRRKNIKKHPQGSIPRAPRKRFFSSYTTAHTPFSHTLLYCVLLLLGSKGKKIVFCPRRRHRRINLIWFPFSAAPAFVGSRGEEARKKRKREEGVMMMMALKRGKRGKRARVARYFSKNT